MDPFAPFSGTRTGKIARLPRVWRDELNRRLDDGVPVKQLTAWLNALPEVRAILESEFQGRPINDQNVCAWKRGGFLDWQRSEAVGGWVQSLVEQGSDLEKVTSGCDLPKTVRTLTLVAMGRLVQDSLLEQSLEKKRRVVLGVSRELSRVEKSKAEAARANGPSGQTREARAGRGEPRAKAEAAMGAGKVGGESKIEPPQVAQAEGDQAELSQIKVGPPAEEMGEPGMVSEEQETALCLAMARRFLGKVAEIEASGEGEAVGEGRLDESGLLALAEQVRSEFSTGGVEAAGAKLAA